MIKIVSLFLNSNTELYLKYIQKISIIVKLKSFFFFFHYFLDFLLYEIINISEKYDYIELIISNTFP